MVLWTEWYKCEGGLYNEYDGYEPVESPPPLDVQYLDHCAEYSY